MYHLAIERVKKKGDLYMASYNSGKMPTFHVKLGFAILLIWISFFSLMLAGCKTSDMSVQEAQNVAIEFQGTYKTVPPRGLGVTISRKVEYYKEAPNVPQEYLKPQKRYTDEELEASANDFTPSAIEDKCTYWRRRAYNEFLNGNISLAIRMITLAPGVAKWDSTKSKALACKAIFLAESGDYVSAEKALAQANRSYRDYKAVTRRHPSDPFYIHNQYFITRGRAAINFARGNLITAEIEFRRAISLLEEYQRRAGKYQERGWLFPEAKINLARTLLWQGRLNEAESSVREAINLDQIKILPHCFIILSEIFYAQERFEDAVVCARTALHMAMALRVPTDAFIRARAREQYGRALIARGGYKNGIEQFNRIEMDLKSDPDTFKRRFKGSAEWGLALIMNGDVNAALEKIEFALGQKRASLEIERYFLAELGALRAMALSRQGKETEALEQFAQHVPQLLHSWQTKNEESFYQGASAFKFKLLIEAYISQLSKVQTVESIEKCFQLASVLQDQIIGRAVAFSSARTAVSDPELASLIRQRQDLDMQLGALKNNLANVLYGPPELINTKVVESLHQNISTLQLAVKSLGREVEERFPKYSNIVNPKSVDVAKVRATLDENEALISIFSGREHTFIWAIPKSGPVGLAKVPIGKSKMAGKVAKLRKALNPGEVYGILELPQFDLELAHSIYEQTLKPVEAAWKDAKHLMVITQGPIGQIPLSILPTNAKFRTEAAHDEPVFSNYQNVDWLIKTHSVTVLPSVSALLNLRNIVPQITERATYAGFGDPYFNQEQLAAAENEAQQAQMQLAMRNAPIQMRGIRVTEAGALDKKKIASIDISMLNRLPDTREEVINIAETLKADPEKDVYIGKQASELTIKSLDLSNRKVVVFATHGLVPGDLDGLDQPALALSSPDVTGNKDEDGLLTMGEIMGLRLNADWVVLSACNTGAAEGEGAEAVSGLGQAFFYAGARSLLVTGWPVETVSAKLLTTDLFKRQLENPGINRTEALRQTMNAMISKNHKQGFSYAHPIFWAPYAIVGDGRR